MQNINKHRNKAENNIRDMFSAVILTKAVSQTDIQPLEQLEHLSNDSSSSNNWTDGRERTHTRAHAHTHTSS